MTASSEAPLHPAMASALRAQRDRLNADFVHARHRYPNLDGDRFAAFLRSTANSVVLAVAEVAPDRSQEVAADAYALGLDLVGQRLAGPGASLPWIDAALQQLARPWARAIAHAPNRVLGAVSNALCQLARHPGAAPDEWIRWLVELGNGATDVDALLRLGQVAAWRAGLAHYRVGALALAAEVDERALRALFQIPPSSSPAAALAAMHDDPWFVPGSAATGLRVARRVGAFRGLGGSFLAPPRVNADGERLVVTSAGEQWDLVADAFGWAMWRIDAPTETAPAPGQAAGSLPPDWRTTDTSVHRGDEQLDLASLGAITSFAVTSTTLAVTNSLTHAVSLLPLNCTTSR